MDDPFSPTDDPLTSTDDPLTSGVTAGTAENRAVKAFRATCVIVFRRDEAANRQPAPDDRRGRAFGRRTCGGARASLTR